MKKLWNSKLVRWWFSVAVVSLSLNVLSYTYIKNECAQDIISEYQSAQAEYEKALVDAALKNKRLSVQVARAKAGLK